MSKYWWQVFTLICLTIKDIIYDNSTHNVPLVMIFLYFIFLTFDQSFAVMFSLSKSAGVEKMQLPQL